MNDTTDYCKSIICAGDCGRPTPPRRASIKPTCPECGRVFDLSNDEDAEEWGYGHDCEG